METCKGTTAKGKPCKKKCKNSDYCSWHNPHKLKDKHVVGVKKECGICFEQKPRVITLECCKQDFCKVCITKWVKLKRTCPVCRKKLAGYPPKPVFGPEPVTIEWERENFHRRFETMFGRLPEFAELRSEHLRENMGMLERLFDSIMNIGGGN